MAASPSAVLFDLDLTLCAHDQSTDQLLAEAFSHVGVEQFCTPADLAAVVDDVPTAETATEFYEFCFAEAACRADASADPSPTLAAAYHDAIDYSAVSFLPGAEAALAAASEGSVESVGLVTNGGRATQTTKLDALGIADAFDATVFCDPADGVEPKPNPEPFQRALSALGANPADAIHVGDSLAADVAGANALGIDSVWIPHDEYAADADHDPTHTLDSLSEFPALL